MKPGWDRRSGQDEPGRGLLAVTIFSEGPTLETATSTIRGSQPAQSAARPKSNRQTIQQAFEAWQAGTAPITDVFPVDMVWRIEGHSDASKEYADRKQFIEEVLAPFGARFPSGERFRPIRIRSIYADGDTVLVVWTATESPTGARTRTATPD